MGRRIHLANLSSGAETGHRRLSHPLTATVICPTVASPAIPETKPLIPSSYHHILSTTPTYRGVHMRIVA